MDITLFDYSFPPELIAHEPVQQRDQSRLMVLNHQEQSWTHQQFSDFPNYFDKDDLLIFNDVKVFPARMNGQTETGRAVEVLLLEQLRESFVPFAETDSSGQDPLLRKWACLVRPAAKLKESVKIIFSEKLSGILDGSGDQWQITFECEGDFQTELDNVGLPPLPPYITRSNPEQQKTEDIQRYQTIYAEQGHAAAAPTAGLHFTETILQQLEERGCELGYVTLNVSRDTFQPVRAEIIEDHKIHGEQYMISEQLAESVNRAKKDGKKITAIGTTTVRSLESAWDKNQLVTGQHETNLFIYPGYQFQVVDQLLTNFHQPKSTLLMMVSAFAGREFVLDAYQEAISKKYRLFSYGDAMLIQ